MLSLSLLAIGLLAGCSTSQPETSVLSPALRPPELFGIPPDEQQQQQASITQGEPTPPDIQTETRALQDNSTVSQKGVFARWFGPKPEPGPASTSDDEQAFDVTVLKDTPVDRSLSVLQPTSDLKLRPGLALEVTVLVAGQREFETQTSRISDNGNLVLPLLGPMNVTPYSLEDLRRILTGQYSRFFVNPQVIVEFARESGSDGISPWGYVTVLGRVKNPGRVMIPATRDLTVSGAIQRSGGFDTSARVNAIRVTRRTSGDDTESRIINLNAVGADGRLEDDIIVMMDDVVFVPEARF